MAAVTRGLVPALAAARARGWPLVMGILNVTPDSFSDGGAFVAPREAVAHALDMVAAGADIVDIGGESTRPGAEPVDAGAEMRRVLPVLRALREASDVLISVDTSKAEVMASAVDAGASVINDVRALREPGALSAAAHGDASVILMHMLGEPRTMQQDPRYDDVVTEVRDFLLERVGSCESAGISRERLVLDPGIGFGKTLEHNLELLRRLPCLCGTGMPVMVGASRKSMLARLTRRREGDRLAASLAVALDSAARGASILRVHDVAATVDALRVQASLGKPGRA